MVNIFTLFPVITAVVTAFIGSSTLITIIYDSFFIPTLFIADPKNQENNNTAIITINNWGSKPATNLSLFIEAPTNIINITNLFSTVPISLPEFNKTLSNHETIVYQKLKKDNQNYLVLYSPKFGFGKGSKIEIKLLTEENNSTHSNYNVSAVYDQGSTISTKEEIIQEKSFSDIFKDIRNFIVYFDQIFQGYGSLVIVILISLFSTTIIGSIRQSRERNRIIKNLFEIRNKIRYNLLYKEEIDIHEWLSEPYQLKKVLFKEFRLLTALDDIFTLVYIRNSKLKKYSEEELIKINKNILRLSNHILLSLNKKQSTKNNI
jgi:hypothetical protein